MKKTLILAYILLVTIFISSCIGNSRVGMLNHSSDDEIAYEKLVRIIEYIENEDEEGLKAMFSKRALDESGNFDEQVQLLFDFYEGKMNEMYSVEGQYVSKSASGGKIVKEVDSYYHIETDKKVYFFRLNDFPRDDVNDEEREILFKDGQRIYTPGIYLPILE